mgnify:CR=1 FL=1
MVALCFGWLLVGCEATIEVVARTETPAETPERPAIPAPDLPLLEPPVNRRAAKIRLRLDEARGVDVWDSPSQAKGFLNRSDRAYWVSGVLNGALEFGNESYLQMDSPEFGDYSGEAFSISAWVYVKATAGAAIRPPLVSKGFDYEFTVYGLSVGRDSNQLPPTPIPQDRWVHLVGTFNKGVHKRYWDGELNASSQVSTHRVEAKFAFFKLGHGTDAGGNCACILDDIRVSHVELTADEVSSIYQER